MKRFVGVLFCSAALLFSPAAHPQDARQVTLGKSSGSAPDLSGVWVLQGYSGNFGAINQLLLKGAVPLQPWAAEQHSKVDRERDDPSLHCLPPGVPRVWISRTPFEIVQTPRELIIFYESSGDSIDRRIYLDGRAHPTDREPTYMGHSTGKWEGDTLVVETVGMNDQTWLDATGLPHSENLKVLERMRRVAHDRLQIDIMIDDPKTYTKSFSTQKTFELKPDWEVLESVCTPYEAPNRQKE